MTCSKMISAIKPYFIYIFLLIGISILTGCASLDTINTPAPKQPNGAGDIIVTGGDQTLQEWTTDAIESYCAVHHWPKDIQKTIHRPRANHPLFNQPRKTQVLISPDDTLHIHFQLGGVLMDNYSHELIIHPPSAKFCAKSPIRYEVIMQPDGDAVIYISKPEQLITSESNVNAS